MAGEWLKTTKNILYIQDEHLKVHLLSGCVCLSDLGSCFLCHDLLSRRTVLFHQHVLFLHWWLLVAMQQSRCGNIIWYAWTSFGRGNFQLFFSSVNGIRVFNIFNATLSHGIAKFDDCPIQTCGSSRNDHLYTILGPSWYSSFPVNCHITLARCES